jgi:hypothetical protein
MDIPELVVAAPAMPNRVFDVVSEVRSTIRKVY